MRYCRGCHSCILPCGKEEGEEMKAKDRVNTPHGLGTVIMTEGCPICIVYVDLDEGAMHGYLWIATDKLYACNKFDRNLISLI